MGEYPKSVRYAHLNASIRVLICKHLHRRFPGNISLRLAQLVLNW